MAAANAAAGWQLADQLQPGDLLIAIRGMPALKQRIACVHRDGDGKVKFHYAGDAKDMRHRWLWMETAVRFIRTVKESGA